MTRSWSSAKAQREMPACIAKAKRYGFMVHGELVATCYLCDQPIDLALEPGKPGSKQIDHRVPQDEGGTDHQSNLFLTHFRCNRAKGTKPYEAARRAILAQRRTSRIW